MSSKITLAAVAVAGVALLATAPVFAAPASGLSPLKTIGANQSIVEETHGWHRQCRKGLNGWHRHVKGVGRVQCTTAKNCYTNVLGFRVCDWF
ncbi:MAG: hypothetical protein K2X41_08450 [Hyphomicrobium sp.]|nr:hypothetical protein [Hyphomicrobium sp.]